MNLDWTLTARYALALALVASALIATHVLESRRLAETADDARTINVSGMQRMLSQRIALLARELSLTVDPVTAELLADKLEAAIGTMRRNHAELSVGWRERAARGEAAYEALVGESGLAGKVERYTDAANTLLERYRGGDARRTRDVDIADRLAMIARNGFLAELDAVVRRHERESVDKAAELKRLETFSMSAGLALLALEALFIFRPMIRRVTSAVGSLERANRSLAEANEELAQFNYRVSHDLVAPVASARGYLELAVDDVERGEPEELPELLGEVRCQLARLDALLIDLADVARAAAHTSVTQTIALQPLLEELVAERTADAPDAPAVRLSLTLSAIDSDPIRIRQILSNLIDNAVKYADPEESLQRVTISSRRESDAAVLEVSDNGIGIDADFREHAFKMFSRGCSSVPGTGLGLYLIARHVNRLDGTLSIKHDAKPTVLRIALPSPTGAAA